MAHEMTIAIGFLVGGHAVTIGLSGSRTVRKVGRDEV
jgi:hypothetical protein